MWLYRTSACQPGPRRASTSMACLQAETEELKKQIEDLSSRLSALASENSSLQNRNSLLEKVVQIRGNRDASVSAQVVAAPPLILRRTLMTPVTTQRADACGCMMFINSPGTGAPWRPNVCPKALTCSQTD